MTSATWRRRPLAVLEAGRRNGRCPDRASNPKSSLGSCLLPFLLGRMTISENGSIDLQGTRLNLPAQSLDPPLNNVQSGRFPRNEVKIRRCKEREIVPRGGFIETRSLSREAAAGSLVKFLKISLCHIFPPEENVLHFELA